MLSIVLRKGFIFPALLMSLGLEAPAFAKEFKWTHYGVRPLAMGNAYVAVADDFNALFYNPAGLARLKDWKLEIINPTVSVSRNTLDLFKNSSKYTSSNTDEVLDALDEQTGKTNHAGFGLTPYYVRKGFGIGIGVDAGLTAAFHGDVSVDVDAGVEVIAPVAFATSFLEDRLSVGTAVKYISKSGVDRNFSIADIDAFKSNKDSAAGGPKLEDYVQSGNAVGVDMGLLFTPIKTMEPTVGLSVMDVGGTSFKQTQTPLKSSSPPDTRQPSVNTGVSFKPIQTTSTYLMASVDAQAINQPIHFSRKFNVGLEWGLGQILKLDAGLHEGEATYGFQIDAWLLILRFASYTEQLGTYAGQDDILRDRRYVVQLKLLI